MQKERKLFMKKQNALKTILILSMMLLCMGFPTALAEDAPQTIPYAESKMAEFSKELSETEELYVEWSNGKIRTAIDIPSGNAYEESDEDGERRYFQTQPNQKFPAGAYQLLERNYAPCFLPIESDAIIDMSYILMSIGDSSMGVVQVSRDGAN